MENSHKREYRCNCGKLLFRGYLAVAVIEIKCRRCGKLNSFKEDIFQKGIASFELKIKEADLAKEN